MDEENIIGSPGLIERIKALLSTKKGARSVRRGAIANSFTRFLAKRPMFKAPYSKERKDNPRDGLQLDKLAEWSDEWRNWTNRTTPTVGVRRAEKAILLARWRDRRRRDVKAKRLRRRLEQQAKFAAAFNAIMAGDAP